MTHIYNDKSTIEKLYFQFVDTIKRGLSTSLNVKATRLLLCAFFLLATSFNTVFANMKLVDYNGDGAIDLTAATITITPASLAAGTIATSYTSTTITATGGTAPYTYAITAGALPTGLALSTSGTLSGTPTVGGTFNFTITATDASGSTGSKTYTLTVNARVGISYTQTITASGGTAPYLYAITAGALPAGLSLSSSGTLSGTPTAGGTFNFTVTATDALGVPLDQPYTLVVNTPSFGITGFLPDGTVDVSYNKSLGFSGGTAPYTFSIASGILPPGLSLSSASGGALSGIPTSAGTYSVAIMGTDASTGTGPYSRTQTVLTFKILPATGPAITIAPTSTSLATATAPSPYVSTAITAAGGTAPYTYAITSGALPAGMSLSSSGTLSGTPTAVGAFNFIVTATDASTFTGSRGYSLTVNSPVSVATTLPNGTAGSAYTKSITASGGTAPYSYTISAGVLPDGLTLSSNGTLSGTPTAGGTFTFTVKATDASTGTGAPYSGSKTYTLTISAGPTITITPTSLTVATVASAYSKSITASGGTSPYTYSVTTGALPAGLSLSSSGTLSGTPTAGGTFNFTVKATDAGSFTGTTAYTLTVNAPTITITPTSLTAGMVGSVYNQSITVSGGTAPYTYSISAGSLPDGLTLSPDGTLSGTPTTTGTFNFTLKATDASTGAGPYTEISTYTFTVNSITITPPSLPEGREASPYNQSITASGGTAPYTYTITAGVLPAGLTLSSSGTLSGTPTSSGTSTFTVTATDASTGSGAPYKGSSVYTLSILTITAPTITIAPTSLTAATVASAYNQSITASGGTSPYTYAVTTGALPAGLTLSSSGTLSGTPTSGGNFNFTVTATDAGSFTGTNTYTLTVNAPTITITPTSLTAGTVASPYNQSITATGGTAPYSYAVIAGALPAGLTLSPSGTLSGTPTSNGTSTFTVTATDASTGTGAPYTKLINYSLTVNKEEQTISFTSLPAKIYGDADFNLTGNASSGLAVNYASSDPSVASISGNTVSIRKAGSVTITASQAGNSVYNAAPAIQQTLTISPKAITVTADAKSKTYGDADPALTYAAVTGLINGDVLTGSLNRSPGNNGGSYSINQGTLTAGNNYILNYQPANLTIAKAVLTVTAENKQTCQGPLPALTVNYSGFKNGDGINSLQTAPAVNTTANSTSEAGNYTLTPEGAASNNYTFVYVNGVLTINALPQVSISSNKPQQISKGDIVELKAQGNASYYFWAEAEGIQSNKNAAVLTVRPLQTTTYKVMAFNRDGCNTEQVITIEVIEDFKLDVTNVITPNGDGYNDKWLVRNIDLYPNNQVKIFDKAGRIIYTKTGYLNEWDGTLNGQPLHEDTYYYLIDLGNGSKLYKGYITIVRN
ncbi:putative Ig domain-containing protein [Solitalea lacus]|uniref:putative Ig domain-containing protein n=1 Tax=Solitalea lacus TaxID=2911172 RepID=UPI001EDB9A7A|nr:putative Ig domain-containing protein [Solitalea lacus]UKJ09251.1 putative Ig domain-containing protein [Solitalea lacus]